MGLRTVNWCETSLDVDFLLNPLHAKYTYMWSKKEQEKRKKRRSIAGIEPVTTGLKYVHVELALCFLVTNYVYPNKIYRLTYHSIAKVTPVLSEKSP